MGHFKRGTLGEVAHGQDYMPIKLSKKFNFWDLQTFQTLALRTLTFKELPLDRNKLNLFTCRKNIKEAADTFKGISLLTYNEESVAKVQLPHRQQNVQLYIPEEAAHRLQNSGRFKAQMYPSWVLLSWWPSSEVPHTLWFCNYCLIKLVVHHVCQLSTTP